MTAPSIFLGAFGLIFTTQLNETQKASAADQMYLYLTGEMLDGQHPSPFMLTLITYGVPLGLLSGPNI